MISSLFRLPYGTFRNCISDVKEQIDSDWFAPDVLVCVMRGGATVTRVLSDMTGVKDIEPMTCENYI